MKLLAVIWCSEIDKTDRMHDCDVMAHRRNINHLIFCSHLPGSNETPLYHTHAEFASQHRLNSSVGAKRDRSSCLSVCNLHHQSRGSTVWLYFTPQKIAALEWANYTNVPQWSSAHHLLQLEIMAGNCRCHPLLVKGHIKYGEHQPASCLK